MSETIRAVQLARDLQIRPSLAYRLPLSSIDAAIGALSSSPTVGLAERTLLEARQRKCGVATPCVLTGTESACPFSRRRRRCPTCRTLSPGRDGSAADSEQPGTGRQEHPDTMYRELAAHADTSI
jgi:hypothetical protein